MEDLDKSAALCLSTAGCSSSGRLVYSPGSCLSSGYCSDDAASASDDVFFGRHGKDCWMSSTNIDTADLLGGSPFDAELSTTAAGAICHESVVDTAVKFDDVVDNWLFNSMSVPSPCVDDDWPLPAPGLSAAASRGLDDPPTDSVLADLLLNQSAYTAASTHLNPTRPEVAVEKTIPSMVTTEPSRKPDVVTSSGACPSESTSTSSLSATKRTLDADSCESSASRRRRSSPCRGICRLPEVTSSSSPAAGSTTTIIHQAALCCDCSTESVQRCFSETFSTPTSTEVDLCRLSSVLRPEWPGLADVVISEPTCSPETSSDSTCEDRHNTESLTKNPDVEEGVSETSTEPRRTEMPSRPVILEALLRSSSKLDANKGSSVALVLIRNLPFVSQLFLFFSCRPKYLFIRPQIDA